MSKLSISVIVLTLNEEHYLDGMLENLKPWVAEIFVVDSLSTDASVDIALRHGAKVVQRPFTNFGDQWNWALEHLPITTDWVMKLDPDERMTPALIAEVRQLLEGGARYDAYRFRRRLWFLGKPMRQTQWVMRLWRRGVCHFSNLLVNEHPIVEGAEGQLAELLEHYDSPDLDHWIRKQNRYSTMRVTEKFHGATWAIEPRLLGNRLEQRMFLKKLFTHLPMKHWCMWLYLLLVSGALLDGYAGRSWAWLRASLLRWDDYKLWQARHSGAVPAVSRKEVGEYDPRVVGSALHKQVTASDAAQRREEAAHAARQAEAERQQLSLVDPERRITVVHYLAQVTLARGGVVRAVLDMASVLAARGHEVILLTHDASDVPKAWRHNTPGCPRAIVADPPLFNGGPSSRSLLRTLQRVLAKADVLHLHEAWGIGNVQAARCARKMGVPYVVSPHGSLATWALQQKTFKKRAFLTMGGRAYLEHAARVLCTAQEELDESRQAIANARFTAIPLICDLTQFQDLPGPAEAEARFEALRGPEFRVLYLSRLHPKKGADVLVEAMSILRDRGVACKLLLTGPESEVDFVQSIRQRVDKDQLADRIFFLGMVTGDAKLSLYEATDVFALPTHMENFGLVQVEAMACRTPVITTRGVAIWRELQEGGAIIVDRDAVAFADAIERLAQQRDELKRMGDAARNWVFKELAVEQVVPQYEQLYLEATGRDAAAASNVKAMASSS